MNENTDSINWDKQPVFLEQAEILRAYLSSLSYQEIKTIWKCNEKIATLNYERLKWMNLKNRLTPALLSYQGLQYQHMAPQVFDEGQWQYVKDHLVILSGFYGMLRATDGVTPYRLEMQAKIKLNQNGIQMNNLYQYWGDTIYKKLTKDDHVILNLASKEYSKVIEPYLSDEVRYVTCIFGEATESEGVRKIQTKGTRAKMLRGEMVHYLAEHNIQDIEQVKNFSALSYEYSETDSSHCSFVFIK